VNSFSKKAYALLTASVLPALPACPTSSRLDYGFDSWYTAVSGGAKYLGTEPVTGNITLYAHWTMKSYGGGGGGRFSEFTRRATYQGSRIYFPKRTVHI
jgi:hypothetical protein